MPRRDEFLGVDDGHAADVGELPQVLGAAANADLDGSCRVEHACKHRLTERAAVMEFRALEGAARVAMGIDVHQPDGPLGAQCLQDRIADRMVAADGERRNSRSGDLGKQNLNVLNAVIKAVTTAKGHIADIAGFDGRQGQETVDMMVRPDALHPPHGPGPEARSGPVGHAEVQRHTYQRHVQSAKICLLRGVGARRCTEERGDPFIRFRPPVGTRKDCVDGLLELGVVGNGWSVVAVLGA